MADSPQEIDWHAIRQTALDCLDATSSLIYWAERSQQDDYDADCVALHLKAIDEACKTVGRAISIFEPGLFDMLAKASVGEGPRPDFRVEDIYCCTAHELAFVLARHATYWVENGLTAQGINPIEQLHKLSPQALDETLRNLTAIKSHSLLDERAFKVIGRLLHLGSLKPIQSLLTQEKYNLVRSWIDREWVAVCAATVNRGDQFKSDVDGPWSRPIPKKELREALGISANTLNKRLTTAPTKTADEIRYRGRANGRKIECIVADIPEAAHEKLKHYLSTKSS